MGAKRKKRAATKVPTKAGEKKLRDRAIGPATDEFGKELAPLGKEAGQVTTMIGTRLLGMVRGLVHGYDTVSEWLENAVAKRLKNVPPEKIVDPNPRIAVPAVQALTYSLGDDVIREMFADLLAADMNSGTKEAAHPAFVEMVKEMAPLDARILRVLWAEPQAEFVGQLQDGGRSWDLETRLTFSVDGANEDRLMEGVTNLIRLGLVEKRWGKSPMTENVKKHHAEAVTSMNRIFEGWKAARQDAPPTDDISSKARSAVARIGLYPTPLGQSFARICLTKRGAPPIKGA